MIIQKYVVRRRYYIINTVLRSVITYNGEYDYRSVLISTWNKTDFQTHFSSILDLLSDCFDGEHI